MNVTWVTFYLNFCTTVHLLIDDFLFTLMGHTVHILYVNKIHRVSKKAKYRHEKKIMCGMNEPQHDS